MKRYFFDSNGNINRSDYRFVGNGTVKYDDVVDRSTFSIDSDRDNARKTLLMGASSQGAYEIQKKIQAF